MCYVHNVSPHKEILWNNSNILICGKSHFIDKWYDRGIVFVLGLFKNDGTILEYEEFMTLYGFLLPARSFNSVVKSLSPSYVHLFKTYLYFNERKTILSDLLLNVVCLLDKKM